MSVPFVAVNAPPTLFFTKLVKAVVLPTFTILLLAAIVFSAFAAVIVIVFVAALTVDVLAILAVITELPVPFSAFIVVPSTLITSGVPLVYVIVPFVPPFVAGVAVTVVVFPYTNVVFVGAVNVNAFVYFCTVTVIVFVPSA